MLRQRKPQEDGPQWSVTHTPGSSTPGDRAHGAEAKRAMSESNRSSGQGYERDSLARVLLRRLWIIAAVLVLFVLGAMVYLTVVPKTHTAVATLLVRPADVPANAPESERVTDDVRVQANVIRSAPILASAVARATTASLPGENPLDSLRQNLRVESSGGILELFLTGMSPQRQVDLLSNVIESFRSYHSDKRRAAAEELLQGVRSEVRELSEALDRAKQARTAFELEPNPARDLEPIASLQQKLGAASQAYNESRSKAERARIDYDQAISLAGPALRALTDRQLEEAFATAADSREAAASIRDQLQRVQRRLGELRQTYLPSHPLVIDAETQERRLAVLLVAKTRAAWREADAAAQLAQGELDRATHRFRMAENYRQELARLDAAAEQAQARLNEARSRMNELEAVASRRGLSVDVVVEPEIDDVHFPPKPADVPTLAASAGAGLLVGLIAALLVEYRTRGEIVPSKLGEQVGTEASGLKLLARLPSMGEGAGLASSAWAAHLDPLGEMAGAVALLRHALAADGSLPKTIAITSIAAGDGKTVLASNLAIILAAEGKRVLLIDANTRKPSLHTVFDLTIGPGLSDGLAGATLANIVRSSAITNLSVITAGEDFDRISDRLDSDMFSQVLDAASHQFDFIVLDTASTDAGDEGRVVASQVEATLLVARSGTTNRKQLESARDMLMMLGANVVGLVVRPTGHR